MSGADIITLRVDAPADLQFRLVVEFTPSGPVNLTTTRPEPANPFADWMAERVIMDPQARVASVDLWRDYAAWCLDKGGGRPMTQTTFRRAMGDTGVFSAGKDETGRKRRRGARLKAVDA